MEDKIKIFTDLGIIHVRREIINNIPTIVVEKGEKIELIIKPYLIKGDGSSKSSALMYYNSEIDLNPYVYTNNLKDIYKAEDGEAEYSNLLKHVAIDDDFYELCFVDKDNVSDEYFEEKIYWLIKLLKASAKERSEYLSQRKITQAIVLEKEDHLEIDTAAGRIVIEKNCPNFPNGCMIKLNGSPIVLIEEFKDTDGEDKIVIKRYPNKKSVNDDEYFNMESYDICEANLTPELIKSILKDIEEEQ